MLPDKKLGSPNHRFHHWLVRQAIAALDNAQVSAQAIESIEKTYFDGGKIAPDSQRGVNTYNYFKSTLERELLKIKFNLARFNATNLLNNSEDFQITEAEIIVKLDAIEKIIAKYRFSEDLVEVDSQSSAEINNISPKRSNFFNIQRDLSAQDEQKILQNLRNLRLQRRIATRFLIVLIFIPLTVQILTKNLVFAPLVQHFRVDIVAWEKIHYQEETIEHYFEEFARYKETLEIKQLLSENQPLNQEKIHQELKKKAEELIRQAATNSQQGIVNLLADIAGLVAFVVLIIVFRGKSIITQQYLSQSFLALNDITKVFIFILLTDMFVGFHSAHGWEVVLENLTSHFGLPENRHAVYIFIATVPVFLDSLFKLLIFNYFTRQSPTSVAILEKMQQ
ncbi:heme binding protein precursor [Synechocystis sp. PCC 6803]|uniref:PxcA-like protein n=1 Tax=Synechocystis sp. (strain ATCC 27184 / PCC 6803 / Kazusa) TaxID=1111708 RepID=PXCL_SYNY3|nr:MULTISPECIES: proton extrusion protein PcxA [unclassified Synechocystis]P72771.1 RecName: Full=PxcA-like protein; Short=PxcL; AltName: Full=CemA-like protein sll1685; AltName: Full=Proton extrusion protein PxcL [Synechocystis sp. PCC 6803 substr. Kazusa]BAM50492.1 proton extrusion protein PcxA [Synechocystis sp. PCC 6803] [Bacillus subtilis BEST7613]AGF50475.1 heme binding protein precursor [Synechocystis sp. PCC 6803]ALJ66557.1 CemA protein [Synechocystis sp. PCC 6803]AVP88401.1 CemA-like 